MCTFFYVAGESNVGVVMSVVLSRHQAVGESLLIDVPSCVVRPQIAFYPNGEVGLHAFWPPTYDLWLPEILPCWSFFSMLRMHWTESEGPQINTSAEEN